MSEQETVAEMLRITGRNTGDFMDQVAIHVEKLEAEILQLKNKIKELEESKNE